MAYQMSHHVSNTNVYGTFNRQEVTINGVNVKNQWTLKI